MTPMTADQTIPAKANTETEAAPMPTLVHIFVLNLCCSLALTGFAVMLGAHWLGALAIGWLGGGIATLVITVALALILPLTSKKAFKSAKTEADTLAALAAWDKDKAKDPAAGSGFDEAREDNAMRRLHDRNTIQAFLEIQTERGECTSLSQLDGYLTGVICSPKPIPAFEWFHGALGAPEALPESVIIAVGGLYDDILEEMEDSRHITPMFDETATGDMDPTAWCAGFLAAAALRADDWKASGVQFNQQDFLRPLLDFLNNGNMQVAHRAQPIDALVERDMLLDLIPVVMPVMYHEFKLNAPANAEMTDCAIA